MFEHVKLSRGSLGNLWLRWSLPGAGLIHLPAATSADGNRITISGLGVSSPLIAPFLHTAADKSLAAQQADVI